MADSDDKSTTSAASARRFTFSRDHGERAAEINDFYNDFMNLSRSPEAQRWEFQECLGGPAFVYIITDPSSGKIVGHHSVVPTPLVRRGESLAGGRTENTIIHPSVRTKIFYPGMEKRALAEISQSLPIIYTIHSKGPQRLRERLGYRSVGRWVIYLPKAGGGYLASMLQRARKSVSIPVPEPLLTLAGAVAGKLHSFWSGRRRLPANVELREVEAIGTIAGEYQELWERARTGYDLTIDRSLELLTWRTTRNPHLRFRTWSVRRDGRLIGVIIAHWHRIGSSAALFVDDVIAAEYSRDGFDALVRCLPHLDGAADSIYVMTLANGTPLHTALRQRFPAQTWLLDRFGARLFDEMLAYDRSGKTDDVWFATGIFSEGMDTSRSETGERIA